MSLNDHINRTAPNASHSELRQALQTLQEHVDYRDDLEARAKRGERPVVLPGGRPVWADPGKRRRGGHVS